jgi:hypothetical protein
MGGFSFAVGQVTPKLGLQTATIYLFKFLKSASSLSAGLSFLDR